MNPNDDKRQWFIADADSDRIRFTAMGHQHLAADLRRVGIDIRQIRTRAQARAALELSSAESMNRLASFLGEHPLLDAILAPLFQEDAT